MIRHVRILAASMVLAISTAAVGAEAPAAGSLLGDLMPLSPGDLAGLVAGGPIVITRAEATGGGTAESAVTTGRDGGVTIRSQSQASAAVSGAPVNLTGGGRLSTGSFGDITMENSAGIGSLQLASGLDTVQQNSVSFAFVLSGLPTP